MSHLKLPCLGPLEAASIPSTTGLKSAGPDEFFPFVLMFLTTDFSPNVALRRPGLKKCSKTNAPRGVSPKTECSYTGSRFVKYLTICKIKKPGKLGYNFLHKTFVFNSLYANRNSNLPTNPSYLCLSYVVNMFDKKQHGQVSSQQAFSASPGRCKNVYVSTYHEINHFN